MSHGNALTRIAGASAPTPQTYGKPGKITGTCAVSISYWRFAETDKGVYVEGETITLSDEFSSMARVFGSAVMGLSPEKSLKHSLVEMRAAVLKPGLQIVVPREDAPECPETFHPAACAN